MRLVDRGLIRPGMCADVVMFDFEAIDDRATWDEPVTFPVGIDYVLVNGEVMIDHGKHTGARPGHVLIGNGRDVRSAR